MAVIDYEKYNNMTQRQLLNSLINAEKKEQKIKDDMTKKLNDTQELIKFLKAKMKESLDKPKYYTLETSPAMKEFRQWRNENPQEAKQIEAELEAEMRGYNENNHSTQG